ncbi:MAG: hypothetical protein ACTTJL_01615 [Hoylesella enoeca]|uniref:hypothetical protein n=1 Tax=Hoylesella enoeca TaxID=76123 RepID=UPI003FA042AB
MNKTKLIFAAALLFTASCANEDVNKDNSNPNNQGMTTFVSGDEPATRTSMDHTAGGKGKFFWTTGDNIWIDNAGTPESNTSSSITGKTNYAKFYFASTLTGTSYPVTYTGKGSTKANEVTIATSQTQSAPNNTEHFATSGDCGTATATGSSNEFAFKLKHQAAYLCILPRCENVSLGKNVYLTKIVITSDNDIAGTYTLSNTGLAPKSGGTKTITLTTQGAGTDPGFKMTNTAADIDRNGAYMVIAPGHHTLTIDCYIKDPVTNVEGPISQTVSTTFHANTITDITANLTPTIYPGNEYYMWDAADGEHYWKGHEWNKPGYVAGVDQPTLYTPTGSAYPQNNSDSRWFHEGSGAFQATHSCAGLPNANELSWYVVYGDPRWDTDKFWATMGHLYKGGMWFRKKSVLIADGHYSTEKSADGSTDLRTTYKDYQNINSSITSGPPSAADIGNYFYLPAFGLQYLDLLFQVGDFGHYWSSSARPDNSNRAVSLSFYSSCVYVDNGDRNNGIRAQPFSDFGDN